MQERFLQTKGNAGKRENRTSWFMNIFEVQGTWNIAKGKLKQKFAQLTDDDLQFTEGKEEELIGRIQKRTGQAKSKLPDVVGDGCAIKSINGCREDEKK